MLHPKGDVTDLHGALSEAFDRFYEQEQDRVSFSKCERGYILDSEGPLEAKAFEADLLLNARALVELT